MASDPHQPAMSDDANTASAATRTTTAIVSRSRQAPRPAPEPGAPAGARRISAGRPEEHQHAGLPRGRPLRAVRNRRGREVAADTRCARCGTELHSCAQCTSFDPGSRFECMQTIPARVTPKNARNSCRSTRPHDRRARDDDAACDDARKAFDDLFKIERKSVVRQSAVGRTHTPSTAGCCCPLATRVVFRSNLNTACESLLLAANGHERKRSKPCQESRVRSSRRSTCGDGGQRAGIGASDGAESR